MIAWLSGVCHRIASDHIVLDVSGVGYEVFVTERDLETLKNGAVLALSIHTVVREDALLLYGFVELAARDLFRLLTSVSGVGPKGALALLSCLSPAEIAHTIHAGQPGPLTNAKGIGKRTSELLIVRLRDRLPVELLAELPEEQTSPTPRSLRPPIADDAISALIHLGYKSPIAASTIDALLEGPEAATRAGDLGALITAALAALRIDG